MKACLHCKTFFDENNALVDGNNKCPECGFELVASANMPADIQKQTIEIEISSRGEWIRKMNEILGYDNSDGMHSEPTPHELAKELRKFVQDCSETATDMSLGYIGDSNQSKLYTLVSRAIDLLHKLRTPPVS